MEKQEEAASSGTGEALRKHNLTLSTYDIDYPPGIVQSMQIIRRGFYTDRPFVGELRTVHPLSQQHDGSCSSGNDPGSINTASMSLGHTEICLCSNITHRSSDQWTRQYSPIVNKFRG